MNEQVAQFFEREATAREELEKKLIEVVDSRANSFFR